MTIKTRLDKLEAEARPPGPPTVTEIFIYGDCPQNTRPAQPGEDPSQFVVYLPDEEGNPINMTNPTEADKAAWAATCASAKVRADEATRQKLIKHGFIQPGDDWTPERGVIRK
jgi:hypothetical protein